MSNSKGNPKLTQEDYSFIREHYSYMGKEGMTTTQLAKVFKVSPSTIARIASGYGSRRYEELEPNIRKMCNRRPASEFEFNCELCGMGYSKQARAENCCRPKRKAQHGTGTGLGKYGTYAGEQEWKYTVPRRIGGSLSKLGRG